MQQSQAVESSFADHDHLTIFSTKKPKTQILQGHNLILSEHLTQQTQNWKLDYLIIFQFILY